MNKGDYFGPIGREEGQNVHKDDVAEIGGVLSSLLKV